MHGRAQSVAFPNTKFEALLFQWAVEKKISFRYPFRNLYLVERELNLTK